MQTSRLPDKVLVPSVRACSEEKIAPRIKLRAHISIISFLSHSCYKRILRSKLWWMNFSVNQRILSRHYNEIRSYIKKGKKNKNVHECSETAVRTYIYRAYHHDITAKYLITDIHLSNTIFVHRHFRLRFSISISLRRVSCRPVDWLRCLSRFDSICTYTSSATHTLLRVRRRSD